MKPIIITAQPIDQYFIWQNHLYIESCLERGFEEEQIHILLYKPKGRAYNNNWEKLKEVHPKLNIFVYEDEGVQQHLSTYIPVLRPHILWQHFRAFPELQEKTIIYTDADILWLPSMDIQELLKADGVNYVSDASSYLNYSYFERKNKEILPEKELGDRDFLAEICQIVGIDKQVAIDNNKNTGGVQYILKNIDASFWKKVEEDVIKIRKHLLQVNKEFYKNESAGIQSWCADLWAVQFNLWYFNKSTVVTDKLKFAWASDPIGKIDVCPILHNAGITSTIMWNDVPCFYKGKYHTGQDPTLDTHLEVVLNNEKSKTKCTWWYANKLKQLKNKYNLNY
jgi:hypothetical protein